MKKINLLVLLTLSIITMAGCTKSSTSDSTIDEPESSVGLPNPMVAYDSIDEALTVLDFTPRLPEISWTLKSVYVIGGDLLQIEYEHNGNTVSYRTAPGISDISGVYDTSSYKADTEISGKAVTLQGNEENTLTLATWNDKDFSYSLLFTNPVTPESIFTIINHI